MKIVVGKKILVITTSEKIELTNLREKTHQTYMSADCGSDIEKMAEDLVEAIDAILTIATVSNC